MRLKSAIVLSTLTLFGSTNISYAGSTPIASPQLLLLTLFATRSAVYSESNKYVPLNTSSSVVEDNEIPDPDPTTVSDVEVDFRHAVNEAIGDDYNVHKAEVESGNQINYVDNLSSAEVSTSTGHDPSMLTTTFLANAYKDFTSPGIIIADLDDYRAEFEIDHQINNVDIMNSTEVTLGNHYGPSVSGAELSVTTLLASVYKDFSLVNKLSSLANAYQDFTFPGTIIADLDDYRAEFEINHQINNVDIMNSIEVTPGNQYGPSITGPELSVTTLLASVYKDFSLVNKLSSYLVGGIGIAYSEITSVNSSVTYSTSLTSSTLHTYDDAVFAWQLGTGLVYDLVKDIIIDLDYRYIGTNNFTSKKNTDGEFGSHIVTANFKYSF